MRCLECGSEAVTERSERTAQGYRRFRCRACGKQFNERSGGVLNRTQYPSDVIALVAAWCTDQGWGCTDPNPVRGQATRTYFGRPSSCMRLST